MSIDKAPHTLDQSSFNALKESSMYVKRGSASPDLGGVSAGMTNETSMLTLDSTVSLKFLYLIIGSLHCSETTQRRRFGDVYGHAVLLCTFLYSKEPRRGSGC